MPANLRSVHNDALKVRHQMMAHRNPAPSVFPTGIPVPHVRICRDGPGIGLTVSEVFLNDYKFEWMLKLCTGVRESLQVEIDRIMGLYLTELPASGEYMVNTTDPSGTFLVPV